MVSYLVQEAQTRTELKLVESAFHSVLGPSLPCLSPDPERKSHVSLPVNPALCSERPASSSNLDAYDGAGPQSPRSNQIFKMPAPENLVLVGGVARNAVLVHRHTPLNFGKAEEAIVFGIAL